MASIVFAADENFLPYLPCNLAQLARFGRAADGVVLVAPPTLDGALQTRIEVAAARSGLELTVRIASELSLYPGAMIDDYWNIAASKLFLGDLLPDLDDVLYLDVDTLVRAPLDELLAWKLRHPIGGVVELNPGGTHLFGTPRQPYFNSGVLRMSLEHMRRERVGHRARELLASSVFTLPDQDVFNLLFVDRFDALPLTFNVFDGLAGAHRGLAAMHDPAIVHFVGPEKAWAPSSRSRFAREWRRLYSHEVVTPDVSVAQPQATRPSRPVSPSGSGMAGRIRAALPASARRSILSRSLGALDGAQRQLEKIQAAVSPDSKPVHALSWGIPPVPAVSQPDHAHDGESDRRLDLLIGLPNSGIHSLGHAIMRAHPEVHFLPDLFHCVATGLDDDSEFQSQLEGTSGRCLMPVLPDQLHPKALCDLLAVFRPRLLFLRRPIVFSYIAEIPVPAQLRIDSRQVSQYALRCDSWIDGVAELAASLELDRIWLTYDGVFATGEDARVLESFYPGAAMPQASGLNESLNGQSDRSVLSIANAVAGLSPAVQAQILRLPGMRVGASPLSFRA